MQITTLNQPMAPKLGSFIYDPNVNQITMFQITTGHTHETDPKGINFLRQLAGRLRPAELNCGMLPWFQRVTRWSVP